MGQMNSTTFDRIVEGLRGFSPPPTIFFGGFGEPLAHPDIVEMVVKAKFLGSQVELITNGTMLTPEISRGLIKADLDMLWVSIDGATPESYADVRLGAALPEVLANLKHFRDIRTEKHLLTPEIGIVFVAMKRNITDLPSVLRIGSQLDVTRFLVTNVLPIQRGIERRDFILTGDDGHSLPTSSSGASCEVTQNRCISNRAGPTLSGSPTWGTECEHRWSHLRRSKRSLPIY